MIIHQLYAFSIFNDDSNTKIKASQAIITEVHLDYEGSCAIDEELLEAASINEYEMIHIYNLNNGNRFTTYAIKAERGSGTVSLNGAAAYQGNKDDLIIICTMQKLIKMKLKNTSLNLFTLKKTLI